MDTTTATGALRRDAGRLGLAVLAIALLLVVGLAHGATAQAAGEDYPPEPPTDVETDDVVPPATPAADVEVKANVLAAGGSSTTVLLVTGLVTVLGGTILLVTVRHRRSRETMTPRSGTW